MAFKITKRTFPKQAMVIGTAGYTAMLCVLALERNGLNPQNGEILVTGATGGVGSVAISILNKLGYEVCASTGRKEYHDYIRTIGPIELSIDKSYQKKEDH